MAAPPPAFLKKLGCKIPGLKKICNWTFDRLEDEAIKACAKSVKQCKQLIDKACRISRKVCDIVQNLACFTLGILCKKTSSAKASPRIIQKFAARRKDIIDRLERRSVPASRPSARGRVIKSKNPKQESQRIYDDLKRGPGIKVIKNEPDLKVFTTPSGSKIQLRAPSNSGSDNGRST